MMLYVHVQALLRSGPRLSDLLAWDVVNYTARFLNT